MSWFRNRRQDAKDLIENIRSRGWRVYVERTGKGVYVLVETAEGFGPEITSEMRRQIHDLKPEMIKELDDIRDPEFRAQNAFKEMMRYTRYLYLTKKRKRLAQLRKRGIE